MVHEHGRTKYAIRQQSDHLRFICTDNLRVGALNEWIQSLRVAETPTLCSCDYLKDAKNDHLDFNSTQE
jgi:hypothetical protein